MGKIILGASITRPAFDR